MLRVFVLSTSKLENIFFLYFKQYGISTAKILWSSLGWKSIFFLISNFCTIFLKVCWHPKLLGWMVLKKRKTTVKRLQCWSRYEMVAFDFFQGSQLEWSRSYNIHVIEIALLLRYGNRKLINGWYIFNSAFSKVYKLQTSLVFIFNRLA